jgi:hypothetical protein
MKMRKLKRPSSTVPARISVRAKTRREARAIHDRRAQYYGKLHKVTVAFRDVHDLLFQAG